VFKLKRLFYFIVIISLISIFPSCTKSDTDTSLKNTTSVENVENTQESTTAATSDPKSSDNSSNSSKPKVTENKSIQKTVKLYFVKSGDDYLFTTENVEITVTNGAVAKAIMDELLKDSNRKRNNIPDGTKVLSLNLVGDTLTVDLSKEFKDNINLGSGYETMMVYSIVNSLTEISTIKKVQFKIEGNIEETLSHIIFDKPFTHSNEPIGN
jgi:germination protein M